MGKGTWPRSWKIDQLITYGGENRSSGLGSVWCIRRSTGQQMPNKFTPPKRSGVAWWMVHGQRNRLVRGEAWNPPFFHKTIIEPLA